MMRSLLLVAVIGALAFMGAFMLGKERAHLDVHNACVVKYDFLPHNQVEAFCSDLLKFKKDSK